MNHSSTSRSPTRRRLRPTLLALLALLPAASVADAPSPPGPTLEALRNAPEVTRFLWQGYRAGRGDDEALPDAFLFVASDDSWLLIEHGGTVAGVGPESTSEVPPRQPWPPHPMARRPFEQGTGGDASRPLCDYYGVLRASLEYYWEARRLWRGRIALMESGFLDLFTAADGRWALVVHSPEVDNPAAQSCIAMSGRRSRLFDYTRGERPDP